MTILSTTERAMMLAVQVARRYLAAVRNEALPLAASALPLLVRLEQMTGFSARSALHAARLA